MNDFVGSGILIILCIIIFVLGAITGVMSDRNINQENWPDIVNRWDHTIPSPMELQRFLGVDDDGVIGKNTMDAWTGYIFQANADPYFDPNSYIERQDDVWQ